MVDITAFPIPAEVSTELSAAEAIALLERQKEGAAYIVLESRTTQVISTDSASPTVLSNWVVLGSNGFSLQDDGIRNDTGRVIALTHGTIGIHPEVDTGGGNRLFVFTSEISLDDGVTYTVADQVRKIYTSNNSDAYNTKESYIVNFPIGAQGRFIAHADSSMSLSEQVDSFRGEVVTGPSALWIVHEVE